MPNSPLVTPANIRRILAISQSDAEKDQVLSLLPQDIQILEELTKDASLQAVMNQALKQNEPQHLQYLLEHYKEKKDLYIKNADDQAWLEEEEREFYEEDPEVTPEEERSLSAAPVKEKSPVYSPSDADKALIVSLTKLLSYEKGSWDTDELDNVIRGLENGSVSIENLHLQENLDIYHSLTEINNRLLEAPTPMNYRQFEAFMNISQALEVANETLEQNFNEPFWDGELDTDEEIFEADYAQIQAIMNRIYDASQQDGAQPYQYNEEEMRFLTSLSNKEMEALQNYADQDEKSEFAGEDITLTIQSAREHAIANSLNAAGSHLYEERNEENILSGFDKSEITDALEKFRTENIAVLKKSGKFNVVNNTIEKLSLASNTNTATLSLLESLRNQLEYEGITLPETLTTIIDDLIEPDQAEKSSSMTQPVSPSRQASLTSISGDVSTYEAPVKAPEPVYASTAPFSSPKPKEVLKDTASTVLLNSLTNLQAELNETYAQDGFAELPLRVQLAKIIEGLTSEDPLKEITLDNLYASPEYFTAFNQVRDALHEKGQKEDVSATEIEAAFFLSSAINQANETLEKNFNEPFWDGELDPDEEILAADYAQIQVIMNHIYDASQQDGAQPYQYTKDEMAFLTNLSNEEIEALQNHADLDEKSEFAGEDINLTIQTAKENALATNLQAALNALKKERSEGNILSGSDNSETPEALEDVSTYKTPVKAPEPVYEERKPFTNQENSPAINTYEKTSPFSKSTLSESTTNPQFEKNNKIFSLGQGKENHNPSSPSNMLTSTSTHPTTRPINHMR